MEELSQEITPQDIRSVRVYRGGILLAAAGVVGGALLLFVSRAWETPSAQGWIDNHRLFLHLMVWSVTAGTGISVVTVHLYMRQFHTLLKILYGIGLAALGCFVVLGLIGGRGFLHILYETPYGTFGFGFVLAALCGIAVKEAFCFGRIEAVLIAVVTPILVLGHLFGSISPQTGFLLLSADALFLGIFAARKWIMPIDLDVGDKSVYMQEP